MYALVIVYRYSHRINICVKFIRIALKSRNNLYFTLVYNSGSKHSSSSISPFCFIIVSILYIHLDGKFNTLLFLAIKRTKKSYKRKIRKKTGYRNRLSVELEYNYYIYYKFRQI